MTRLRPLDFLPITHQGESMWLLRDPLQLSDKQLIFPHGLAQLLIFLDGTRGVAEIHADFCRHVGQMVDYNIVTATLARLDEAFLLDNERAAQARVARLAEYRAQPYRRPALADVCYPATPEALARRLEAYGDGRRDGNEAGDTGWRGRGIISPHIDYDRGGPVYAAVWRQAAAAVAEAELVLIFGTDHNGGPGAVTLTRQDFATPYGTLPTDTAVVDTLAAAVGPSAFDEELHHINEHSVELSAVWFHHYRRAAGLPPCPIVPILCGSFHHFVRDGAHPADDPCLTATLDALQRIGAGRRVLAVASVDFAHVGPAFGDETGLDATRQEQLRASDHRLLTAIHRGDADDFYQQIAATGDRHRICGFSSIYLLLRYLGDTRGQTVAYDQCSADPAATSFVSIGGVLLD